MVVVKIEAKDFFTKSLKRKGGNELKVLMHEQEEYIVRIHQDELAQICGFSSHYVEKFKELVSGTIDELPIGEIYSEAREIVKTIPDIITAVKVINSGAGKLKKHLDEN